MAEIRQDVKQMALLVASALLLGGIALWSMRQLTQAAPAPDLPAMRPAGSEAMDTPPEDWNIVVEQSGGSFPASDSPGNH